MFFSKIFIEFANKSWSRVHDGGGYYELLNRIIRFSIRKVLRNAKLKFDKLNTVLNKIEDMLTKRPLTSLFDKSDTLLFNLRTKHYMQRLFRCNSKSQCRSNCITQPFKVH